MTQNSLFQTREEDYNKDGKYDELNFQMEIQLKNTEAIFSVKLLLIFDYKLPVSIINCEGVLIPLSE